MVRLYAGLGDKERLHEWLEKADQERAGEFLFLRWTPVGRTLKGDPKFEEILRRMGLESHYRNISGLTSIAISEILSAGTPNRRACSRMSSGLGDSYSQ